MRNAARSRRRKDDPIPADVRCASHWGHPKLNIAPLHVKSPTGTQFLHGVGIAEASFYYDDHPKALKAAEKAPLGKYVTHESDEVVYISSGDGATSEGEFFESLNTACQKKLPVIYLVEDNGLRNFCSRPVQTAGGSVFKLVAGYPGLLIQECDGTDVLESYATF